MKKQLNLIVAMLMAFMIVACSNGGQKQGASDDQQEVTTDVRLKQIVSDLSKDCPATTTVGITLTSVDYADHTVTMYFDIDAVFLDYDGIKANEEAFRSNMLLSWANNSEKGFVKVMDAIVEANADWSLVFEWNNEDPITMRFTAEELKDARSNSGSDPEVLLKAIADNGRLQTPTVVDVGLVLSDVVLEPKYYIYVYDCDESEYDIDEMNKNRSLIKESMLDAIQNETEAVALAMYSLIKKTNRGLAFKYVGTTSGKTCIVQLEPDEF